LPDVKRYPEIPENPYISDSVVLAVITDRKRGLAASGTDIQWYEAVVRASQQYYPFGSE